MLTDLLSHRLTRLTNLRDDFAVLGGFVDFLGPSLFASAAGGITGTANIAPVSLLSTSPCLSCSADEAFLATL